MRILIVEDEFNLADVIRKSLEKEKYVASLVLAYKIAKYFDLSIEDVFDFSDVEGIQ